jgi:hypothetical protein
LYYTTEYTICNLINKVSGVFFYDCLLAFQYAKDEEISFWEQENRQKKQKKKFGHLLRAEVT